MVLFSLQILLINFIVAAFVTSIIYFTNKKVREINPFLLYIVSSVGTFLGSIIAVTIPNLSASGNSIFIKTLILIIPSVILSIFFIFIWVKGSKSEGYI